MTKSHTQIHDINRWWFFQTRLDGIRGFSRTRVVSEVVDVPTFYNGMRIRLCREDSSMNIWFSDRKTRGDWSYLLFPCRRQESNALVTPFV